VTAADEITIGNFQGHPRIVEVRTAVGEVDAAIARGGMKKVRKDNLCVDGRGDSFREKHVEPGLKIRKLVIGAGSDDSFMTETFYYDARGRLRFVFVTSDNVYNYKNETRIYFDADGRRIFTADRAAVPEEPGGAAPDITRQPFTKPSASEERQIEVDAPTNPAKVFDAPALCD
jgi:hypothetical protein